MFNPKKILEKSIPGLTAVLESIHAYLEDQLKVQQYILQTNELILIELRKINDKKD